MKSNPFLQTQVEDKNVNTNVDSAENTPPVSDVTPPENKTTDIPACEPVDGVQYVWDEIKKKCVPFSEIAEDYQIDVDVDKEDIVKEELLEEGQEGLDATTIGMLEEGASADEITAYLLSQLSDQNETYNKALLQQQTVQDLLGEMTPLMRNTIIYTYSVLQQYEDVLSIPRDKKLPHDINRYHDQVAQDMFSTFIPEQYFKEDQNGNLNLEKYFERISNNDGSLNRELFEQRWIFDYFNNNKDIQRFINEKNIKMGNWGPEFATSIGKLEHLKCLLYNAEDIMYNQTSRYTPDPTAIDDFTGENPNAIWKDLNKGKSGIQSACRKHGESIDLQVDAWFEMLSYYRSNGNLANYDGNRPLKYPVRFKLGQAENYTDDAKKYWLYADKGINVFAGKKSDWIEQWNLRAESGQYMSSLMDPTAIDLETAGLELIEDPFSYYNKYHNLALKELQYNILRDGKGELLYKDQTEQDFIFEFLRTIDPNYILYSEATRDVEWVAAQHLSPGGFSYAMENNVVTNAQRGGIDSEEFAKLTLREQFEKLLEFKDNLRKEITVQNKEDIITVLEYYNLPTDTKAIEDFLKVQDTKRVLMDALLQFEQSHMPTVNTDGSYSWPKDPQQMDAAVIENVGRIYFKLDEFEEELSEYMRNNEINYMTSNQHRTYLREWLLKNVFGSDIEPGSRDAINYVKNLSEKEQDFLDGYDDWYNFEIVPQSLMASARFEEQLIQAIQQHSNDKTNELGHELEKNTVTHFLTTAGVPAIAAEEIKAGLKHVDLYYHYHIKGLYGDSWQMDRYGRLTLRPNSSPNRKIPSLTELSEPVEVKINGSMTWLLAPHHRLEGWFIDEEGLFGPKGGCLNVFHHLRQENPFDPKNKENKYAFKWDMGKVMALLPHVTQGSFNVDAIGKLIDVIDMGPEEFIPDITITEYIDGYDRLIADTLGIKLKLIAEGKLRAFDEKQIELNGMYSEDAEWDEEGNLIKGKLIRDGKIQRWEKKYASDMALHNIIASELNNVYIENGELVLRLPDNTKRSLTDDEIIYYQALEVRFGELHERLYTGSIGPGGDVQTSAMLELSRIMREVNAQKDEQILLQNTITKAQNINAAISAFNYNWSKSDKAWANVQQTFNSFLPFLGMTDEAIALREEFQKEFPAAYKSEWGNAGLHLESMIAESTGSVSLFMLGMGLSFIPGAGSLLSSAVFFGSGYGSQYIDLEHAKQEAIANINALQELVDDPNTSDQDRMYYLEKIEHASRAANQSEFSMILASSFAGGTELFFERFISIPLLKKAFQPGGKFASKWNNLGSWEKVLAVGEYKAKGMLGEFIGENLTTVSQNIINMIQVDGFNSKGFFEGIIDKDGIDFDAQMQLLVTTLMISGPSDVMTIRNIVNAELSHSKDKAKAKEMWDNFEDIKKQLNAIKNQPLIGPNGQPTQVGTLKLDLENKLAKIEQEIIIHSEQSINRLKYLDKKQITQIDQIAIKKRNIGYRLRELGATGNPRDPQVKKQKQELLDDLAKLTAEMDLIIDTAIKKQIPNIEGTEKNEYSTRPEAEYLAGLYESSNARTQRAVKQNGGLYFEINDGSYEIVDGVRVGFKKEIQDKLVAHYKKLHNGNTAKAVEQVNEIFASSIQSGKFALNLGKDAILFTSNAFRAIYNTPDINGNTDIFTLQEAEMAAVSGMHEVFHINHSQKTVRVKMSNDEFGNPIYKDVPLTDVLNEEQGKADASFVIVEMDKMMANLIKNKEIPQEVYDHYLKQKEHYKNSPNQVEEVLNLIGDLTAVGYFDNVKGFKNKGAITARLFDVDTNFGFALKSMINNITTRLYGKEHFNLATFENGEQIFNYIKRYYNGIQGNPNYEIVKKFARGDEIIDLGLKFSKGQYQSSLQSIEEERLQLKNQYDELIAGLPPGDPKIEQYENEFKELDKKLETEYNKVSKNLSLSEQNKNTIEVIKAEKLAQQEQLDKLKKEKLQLETMQGQLTADQVKRLEFITKLLKDPPRSGKMERAISDLIDQNKGIITNFLNTAYKPTQGGVTKSDFTSAMNEEIANIIRTYNPDALVTYTDPTGKKIEPGEPGYVETTADFGFYLRETLFKRVGNILDKARANIQVFEVSYDDANNNLDIEDLSGIPDNNSDNFFAGDGIETSVIRSELRQSLPFITDKIKENIINDVAVIIDETQTPSDKTKTRSKLNNQFNRKFKNLVKKGMPKPFIGRGKDKQVNPDFRKYLLKNKELLVKMIALKHKKKFPELSVLLVERANVKQTNELQANPDYTGFIESTTAGNSIWDLIQFDDPNEPNYVSENDFVALFTDGDVDPDGLIHKLWTEKGVKGWARNANTRYQSLIDAISIELAFDATFDAIKLNDPANIDNFISYYAELGKRDPRMKFSKSGVTAEFPVDYNWDNFKPTMNKIFDILEKGDHSNLIILDPEDPNFFKIKGHLDEFTDYEVAAAYSIVRELGPENIDQSRTEVKKSILQDETSPSWLTEVFSKRDWNTNKDIKDRKATQASRLMVEELGADIFKVLGLDIIGFHNGANDSAGRKKLIGPNGKNTVKITQVDRDGNPIVPKSYINGREVPNQSIYGANGNSPGPWDVIGWEWIPEHNMFRAIDQTNPDKDMLGMPWYSVDPVGQHGAEIRKGEYHDIAEQTKTDVLGTASNLDFDINDVKPFNNAFAVFKQVNDILSDPSLTTKEERFKKLEPLLGEIESASKANRQLATHIAYKMVNAVATGKMDADVFIGLLSDQSSIAKGFRALSGLDFIYVTDGPQTANSSGEHMDPNVHLMIKIKNVMLSTIKFDDAGNALGFKDGVDPQKLLATIFDGHTQALVTHEIRGMFDNPVIDGVELKNMSTSDLFLERIKLLPPEIQENFFGLQGQSWQDKVLDLETSRLINERTANIVKQNEEIAKKENNQVVTNFQNKERNLSGEGRGATVLDFDDTLIVEGNNVIIATHPETGEQIPIPSDEFHSVVEDLTLKGFEFNFDDFVNVDGGKEGPLFEKLLNQIEKYGVENVYVLTARQPEAAAAVQGWLNSKGVSLPIENIVGLGTKEAGVIGPAQKVGWIRKNLILNGYNDILFADDGQKIVEAVKEMMKQHNISGKTILAGPEYKKIHAKYSGTSKSATFNLFMEQTSGIPATEVIDAAQGRARGKKVGSFNNVIAYSAEDFNGLMYQFLAPGKEGEYQYTWIQENLIKPYSRGEIAVKEEGSRITRQYKVLLTNLPKIKENLKEEVNYEDGTISGYTLDHAIRVYLWDKSGIDIPNLSDQARELLISRVKSDVALVSFADQLGAISNQADGYTKPSNYWLAENIASDISQLISVGLRQKHMQDFIENKNEIFSEENLNKIEAIHGPKFREALENILDRMETGNSNGKTMITDDRLTRNWNNWVNNSVGAIMFLNGRSAVLQTLSSFNYIKMTGPNNPYFAAQAFANQPQFWKDFVEIWNSDYLKSRRSGQARGINESELRAAIEGADNKAKAAVAWLLEKGFKPTQIADSFAIASGGAAYVRNYADTIDGMLLEWQASGIDINTLIAEQDLITEGDLKVHIGDRNLNDLSPEEVKDLAYTIAFEKFVMETETGQQSSRQDMLSQQQTGSMGRLILAFKNTPMQYTRKILRSVQDLKNGRGNPAEHIGRLAYYGVVQNLMFNGLQQALFAALGEEDEEWEKKEDSVIQSMIDSIISGMGLQGAVITTVKNGVLEFQEQDKKGWNADHTYTILEFANLSPTIGSKLRKIYSSIKGQQINEDVIAEMSLWDPQNPAWASVANLIEGLTNIPIADINQKINNLIAISDGEEEWWKNLAVLLGWNTWDVGIESKAQKLRPIIKERLKEEKEQERLDSAQDDVDVIVEEEKKKEEEGKGKDVNQCGAVKTNGERCTMPVDKAGDKCQYHASADEKAKMKRCEHIKKNGKQCGNMAVNDAGRCNVPQHQPDYEKSK